MPAMLTKMPTETLDTQTLNTETRSPKTLLAALQGEQTTVVPFWLMRQAGRYLPEYRELRARKGGFLELVYDPESAAEVTLQPVRRFGMHGAILFSDILVVPQALGQGVTFEAGEGPRLAPLARDLSGLSDASFAATLAPIGETIRLVRGKLATEGFDDTALIGFAGAPWTVACYMAEGQGSRDFHAAKRWAYEDPAGFDRLLALVAAATVRYLAMQIEAGAEAVQLFDSWAGLADEELFSRCVLRPTRAITDALHEKFPHIPIIGFPRGAGASYAEYAGASGVTALGIDQHVPAWLGRELQQRLPVQGNLDPARLLAGGGALDAGIDAILENYAGHPFIFNLGHGIDKATPPGHVAQLATRVKGWQV